MIVDIKRKVHRTGAFPKLSEGTKKCSRWLFLNAVSSFPGYHLSGGFEGFLWVLVSFWFGFGVVFFALKLPDTICPSALRHSSEKGKEEADAGSSI